MFHFIGVDCELIGQFDSGEDLTSVEEIFDLLLFFWFFCFFVFLFFCFFVFLFFCFFVFCFLFFVFCFLFFVFCFLFFVFCFLFFVCFVLFCLFFVCLKNETDFGGENGFVIELILHPHHQIVDVIGRGDLHRALHVGSIGP